MTTPVMPGPTPPTTSTTSTTSETSTTSTAAGTAATAGTSTEPSSGRPGYLYRKVALYLVEHPDEFHQPGAIKNALGVPSSGAVFEVLKKMTAAGHATHRQDPYHRFQVTAAGIAAAGTMPPAAAHPTGAGRGGARTTRRGPVTRPNGEHYFPRKLAGATDIDVLRRLRAKRIAVLLNGPPGTGKTAMVEAAFDDQLSITGTGDTVVEDFVGTFIPLPDGGYEYVYGPLVQAMRQGRALFIDDATLIPPRVLAVLYPAMDGRRVIHLTGYRNERVEAVDGFYVIAAHNPGVHGAILTEALASRFDVHIEVTTDFDLAKHLGVPTAAIAAARTLNDDLQAGTVTWAPQLRELLGFNRVRKTLGLPAAVANLAGRAPADDRPAVIAALSAAFGTTVTALTLGKQH